MAFYGVNTADANAVIEMAIGGKAATQLYEGERKFDIRIRYQKEFRDTQENIENLMVPTQNGAKIPMKEIADIRTITGPAFIYRDNNMRYIAVKFSVRGRDLGSTIKDAQQKVKPAVKLPEGYKTTWNGEFENQEARNQNFIAGGTDLSAGNIPDPVYHIRQCKRCGTYHFKCALCIDWRYTCTAYNRYEFQHLRRHWIHCIVWRMYSKWRNPHLRFPKKPR